MIKKISGKILYRMLRQHPFWQQKRLRVMERDDWACQVCFSKQKTLNVHHHYYLDGHKPWQYPMDCFVTLCEDHHLEEHKHIKLAGLMARYAKDPEFRKLVDNIPYSLHSIKAA